MKNFTLTIFMLLLSLCGFAQGLPIEGFETWPVGGTGGWATYQTGGTNVNTIWKQSIAGSTSQLAFEGDHAAFMERENVPPGNPLAEDWLITKQFVVPANPIVRFMSKLTQGGDQGTRYDVRISENAEQMAVGNYVSLIDSDGWGELEVNPGLTQISYTEKILQIPASYVNKSVYIAFVMKITGLNGDRWLIDNVMAVKKCDAPTIPPNSVTEITQFTAKLGWVAPAGGTTVWELEVIPSTATPTGVPTDTHNGLPPYTKTGLLENVSYKYYVRAVCSPGNYSDWIGPQVFKTIPSGSTCAAPKVIPNSYLYSTTDNTLDYGDDIEGAPGAATGCGTAAAYLNGNEVVYQYNAVFTGLIRIAMTNNGPASGMFVYTSCANVGTTCAAGGIGSATQPVIIPTFAVTAGQTYYIVISTSGSTQTTPYTLTIQQVNCLQPENVSIVPASNSAQLTWTNPSAASAWEYIVQPAGGDIPAGSGVPVATNPTVNAPSLIEATSYEYWVRADCGNSTFSAWAGPFPFSTTQVVSILNYSQDFDGPVGGFTLNNGTQVNKWVIGSAINNTAGGTKSLYISNDGGVTNAYTITSQSTVHAYKDLQIPPGVEEFSVSFDWRAAGQSNSATTFNDYLRVWLVPNTFTPTPGTLISAASGGVQLSPSLNLNPNFTRETYTVNDPLLAGTARRLIFEWRNDATVGVLPAGAIDNVNISVVICRVPTNLTVTTGSLTPAGATITWNPPTTGSPTYDYYVSTSATPPAADATVTGNTGTTPSKLLDTLESATTYYVWVRSNCGADDGNSFWVGPVSFYTPQIPAPLTFTDDFESVTPSKWTLVNGTQVNKWVVGTAVDNGGDKSLYISNDNGVTNAYTITTTSITHAYRDLAIPPSVTELEVKFDWKAVGEVPTNDYFNVFLAPLTFNPTAGQAITAASIAVAGGVQVGGTFNDSGTFTTAVYSVPFLSGPATTRRLIFQWRNNASLSLGAPAAIDNINVSVVTCPSPTALVLGAVTPTSAIVAWTPPTAIPASYDFYIDTKITNVPVVATIPTGNVVLPTATFDDEIPVGNTNFYVWVRSNCGPGDVGRWTGPLQVSLPQVAAALNYNDNLEGSIGWTISNGAQVNQWVVGNATSSTPSTSIYISNNVGQTNKYATTTSSVTHVYRDIQLPSTPQDIGVSFQWKADGDAEDRLRAWLVPVNFVPVPGTQITAGPDRQPLGANFSGNGSSWKTETFVLSSTQYVGQVRRLIFEWRNNATGGIQPPAAIDNINVRAITCPAVTNLVVNGTGVIGDVTLSWTPVGTETVWEIVLQNQTLPDPTDNPVTVITVTGTPSHTLTLPAGVFYEFFVRPVCSPTDKGFWAGPQLFSIFSPPACAKIDLYDEDLEVINPGTNFSICPGEDACVDLKADYLSTGATTSYAVESIPYVPQFPFTGGEEMNVTIDDSWSAIKQLPADFKFCFFGQKQTKYQVGSNGVVSFNANYAVGQAGTCPYQMGDANVPTTGTALQIKNAIFGVYQDIDPSKTPPTESPFANPSINFQVLGTYPCRAVVINFSEIAQWSSSGACETNPAIGAQTSQIVFYEISNIIEVYVKHRVPCTQSWGGDGVIGIINATGSAGASPVGYNIANSGWTIEEKAFRFTPNGPSNVVFEWLKDGAPFSTNDDITVCVTGNTPVVMTARATYTGCGTDVTVVESKVTITPEQPIIITQTTNLLACPTAAGANATFNLMDGVANAIVNPQNYTFTFYASEAEATAGVAGTELPVSYTTSVDKTIWVRIQLTGRTCFAVDSFTLTVKQSPTFDLPVDFTICQGSTKIIPVTNPNFDLNGATVSYVWKQDTTTLPDTGSSIVVGTAGTYSVTVTVDGCSTTKSVIVTVTPVPVADDPADVVVCTSYTLPALSPDNKYYTGPNATGSELAVGTVINNSQTIYVFVQGGTPDCTAQNSFDVTIVGVPVVTTPGNQTKCLSYTLPPLTVGNYYDGPGGTGTLLPANSAITTTTLVYVFATAGTVPCTAEASFTVTIVPAVNADNLPDIVACETYELLGLSTDNTYHTATGGTGQTLAPGTDITTNQTIYVYANNGTCTDEESFTVTIVPKPLEVTITEGCQGGQYVLGVVLNAAETNYNAGNVSFAWSRSAGGTVIGTGPTIVANELGEYFVTVTPTGSSVSCYQSESLDVDDITCMIQRGISPNGDGKNDTFDLTAFDVQKISIFNRYGTEVFSLGKYTNQWHGQGKNDDELPTGTYFYTVQRATGENITGWVYINREE